MSLFSRGQAGLALLYSWILFASMFSPNAGESWSAWYDEIVSADIVFQLWLKGMVFATPWLVYSLCFNTGFRASIFACAPFIVFPYVSCMGIIIQEVKGLKIGLPVSTLAYLAPMAICGTILLFYFFTRMCGEEEDEEEEENLSSSSQEEKEKEKEE